MRHGVAGNTVDSSRSVDLVDAIGVSQGSSCDLAGSSFLPWIGRAESEDATPANAEQSADDALLTHAKADHRSLIALLLQELHHDDVVVERVGCAHDLDEISWIAFHLCEGLFKLFG